MHRFSSFLNILILLGAVQGFIIGSLLYFSQKSRLQSRLLAVLIFLISTCCFNLYAANNNWFGNNILRFLGDIIPLVTVMPFGPLIYFYVQANINPSFKLTKKHYRHFYPAIIDFVPSITVIIFIRGLIFHFVKNKPGSWALFIDTYDVYADIPRWVSITIYVWFSWRLIPSQKANTIQPGNIKWLRQLVRVFAIFQCLWLVYLVPYVMPKYSDKLYEWVDWYPLYIPMAFIIYWVGIKGYLASQQQEVPVKTTTQLETSLPEEVIQSIVAKLKHAMQTDKLYLNPALNLEAVAKHTGLAPKNISAVLNRRLQKSFNEFVNEYRIKEFIVKFRQPGSDSFTITGIAFECGFNSQATFQRTFKLVTGMPPTEYLKTAPALP